VPLNELLTKSSLEVSIPLVSAPDAGAASKKSKTVGGCLSVRIKIRSPLMGPEKVEIEERKLIVGPWPDLKNFSAPSVPRQLEAQVDSNKKEITPNKPSVSVSTSANFNSLDLREKSDPHSVDFIDSNDALDEEIKICSELVASGRLEEDELFSEKTRLQILQTKLQMLEIMVNSEKLSLEQYIEMIKDRLKKDQIKAVYLRSFKDAEHDKDALRVFRRVKIMQEEIKSVEES
jgi:hypothetical protein